MAALPALASQFVSPVTGLVRRMGCIAGTPGGFHFHNAFAELADVTHTGADGEIAAAGGAGFTREEALTRALFEAIERYCGGIAHRDVWGCAASSEFLSGEELPLFTEAQYTQPGWPFRPLRAGSTIWWTRGVSLVTGRTRYVPSALVHVPYRACHADECLAPSVSTGMAAGRSWEAACLAGIYEVCERDAFARMWEHRRSGRRLVPAIGSALERQVARALGGTGARVDFIDITNDLSVPVVVAILRHNHRRIPIRSIGASAKPDLASACRKALSEAIAGHGALVEHLQDPQSDWTAGPDFENVTDWRWRPLVYLRSEMQRELDFITASEESRWVDETSASPASEGPTSLQALTAQLSRHFREIVAIDLTTAEIADSGIHVVKVMAPDAAPLEPDHRYLSHAHARLHRPGVPRNPLPHPFS